MDGCSATELHPQLWLRGSTFGSFLMYPRVVSSHSPPALLPECSDHRSGHTWQGCGLNVLSRRVLQDGLHCRIGIRCFAGCFSSQPEG